MNITGGTHALHNSDYQVGAHKDVPFVWVVYKDGTQINIPTTVVMAIVDACTTAGIDLENHIKVL